MYCMLDYGYNFGFNTIIVIKEKVLSLCGGIETGLLALTEYQSF